MKDSPYRVVEECFAKAAGRMRDIHLNPEASYRDEIARETTHMVITECLQEMGRQEDKGRDAFSNRKYVG